MPVHKPAADDFVPEQMTEREIAKAEGKAVQPASRFTNEQYGNIESWQDAMSLAMGEFGTVVVADDEPLLGTGFKLLKDDSKGILIGVPMLLLDWSFHPGDYGDDFVSARVVTQDETGRAHKYILNDGGTGICRDLKMYTQKTGRTGGLLVKHGLRVSDYPTDGETGDPLSKSEENDYRAAGKKVGKGRTYYLDYSA